MKNSKLIGLMLLVGFNIYGTEATQCTIRGCTDGEIKLTKLSTTWEFDVYTRNYLSNPFLDDFSDLLRDQKLIGERDRVDHLQFELAWNQCVENNRAFGPVYCSGATRFIRARVRKNEVYLEEQKANRFQYLHLDQEKITNLEMELNTLPISVGEIQREWLFSFSRNGKTYPFNNLLLWECRSR